jgi:hypothetical protein
MNKKAFTILLLPILFLTMFAVIVKPAHAMPIAYSVGPAPSDFLTLADALAPSSSVNPGDHLHVLAGETETLAGNLIIGISNLSIFGAPIGVTPSIDVNGYTISIQASNVLIYGLYFYDSGTSPTCIDLTSTASFCTIRNCTIMGNLSPSSIGISISDSVWNLIGNNTIQGCGIGIKVSGRSSLNRIELNNIDYSMMTLGTAYGVQIGVVTTPLLPNLIWWNNIFAPSSASSGNGQELWDENNSTNNVFDGPFPPPYESISLGNYESSYASATPPYIVRPYGARDNAPLARPVFRVWGDVNLDGMDDIYDAQFLASHFNTIWCQSRWDTSVNLKFIPDKVTDRQIIDIYDAISLSSDFDKILQR